MGDWYILWGHMKRRITHPLRLIAFNIGNAAWHWIERFTLLGGLCVASWRFWWGVVCGDKVAGCVELRVQYSISIPLRSIALYIITTLPTAAPKIHL